MNPFLGVPGCGSSGAPAPRARRPRRPRFAGYILMPVVIMLTVVATISYLLSVEGAIGSGATARELEALQARFVAEAGLGEARWQLAQNTTCGGYSDISATAFGPGSYSAQVSPTTASPVTLTAKGTLPSGARSTLTREGVKVYEAPTTLVLQLGAVPGADTLIDAFYPRNYGGSNDLRVSADPAWLLRTLLRFDVTAIPANVTILSAQLELHLSNVNTPGSASVHRASRSWVEGTRNGGGVADGATWATWDGSNNWAAAGGDFDPEAVAEAAITGSDEWIAWEIAPLVDRWRSGEPNHGLLIQGANGLVTANFDSREHTDATLHPKLTITYACECGIGGTPGTLVFRPGAAGKDAMLRGAKNYGADPYAWIDTNVPYHSLFEFDLSALVPGVIVTSALLEIHQSSADLITAAGDLDVHRVTRTWVEGTGGSSGLAPPDGVTWDTSDGVTSWTSPGGDYDPTVVDSVVVNSTGNAWHQWDVTGVVQEWTGGVNPNYGFLLRASSGSIEKLYLDTGEGNDSTFHPKLTIEYTCPCNTVCEFLLTATSLLVSTQEDIISPSGAPGLDAWTNGEALIFADPDLVLEPGTTTGTFYSLLGLDGFAADSEAKVDALHWVASDISVGSANSVELLVGDLLLSTFENEILTSLNSVTVNNEDVFVFRPTSEGDYSAGTFIFLIDGSNIHAEDNTAGISLVEKDTPVGDGSLAAGMFLIGVGDMKDIYVFDADDVGLGTSSPTAGVFADGVGLEIDSPIAGIDLAEDGLTLGDHTIPEGAILLTLNNDDTDGVGDNAVPVDGADVFYLTFTQVGSSPIADATLLFEGLDVNLVTSASHLHAFTLSNASPPTDDGLGPIAHWKLDDGTGLTAIDSEGGHDGTLVGPPAWVAGTLGDALDFDGSGDRVDATAVLAAGSPAISVMAWVTKRDSGDDRLVCKSTGTSIPDHVFCLGLYGTTVRVRLRTTDNGGTSNYDAGSVALDTWTHLAFSYDGSAITIYQDGVATATHPVTGDVIASTQPVTLGNVNAIDDRYLNGLLDDVRIYDRALSGVEIADLFIAGSSGSSPYVETYEPWFATAADSWQTVDLSSLDVPADAVLEMAVINASTNFERSGGVRAVGSVLDRRFLLHEAEPGGVDTVTLHVQADGSSQIEYYSDHTSDVSFALLGYWTVGSYVETFETFKAGGDDAWLAHDLSSHGVGPNQVVEIVVANASTNGELLAGVRPSGETMQRRFLLHEAEGNGIDAISLLVESDAASKAEFYAGNDADIDFHLVGYWSTPPGSYTEAGGVSDQLATPASWQEVDLTSFGVPAGAIAQFVITNDDDGAEKELGVRATGSSLERRFDLHEAEAGGSDASALHVRVDAGTRVEWYSETGATDAFFYPVGWWVPAP